MINSVEELDCLVEKFDAYLETVPKYEANLSNNNDTYPDAFGSFKAGYLLGVQTRNSYLEEKFKDAIKVLEVANQTYWYDPFEGGACMHCDANLHPNAMGRHQQLNGESCPAQEIQESLVALKGILNETI